MKSLFTTLLMLYTCGTALAGCPVGAIEKALGAPLDGLDKVEREVTDLQSTEGGAWRIFRNSDGQLVSLLRIDGGESGMSERRLSVLTPDAYGITVTRVDYLQHAFIDNGGPNGTAKRTTEYFYYCDGKLYVPPSEYSTLDGGEYAKAGAEAQMAMIGDKDVADVTKALRR
ncbi:hypothetical protein [Aestuariivirga sp.]|uniref:hypothetical protein n=1 Tax=Aestuariivirga sp. TaxID=2650926 RepID=UPI0035B2964E